MKGPPRLPSTSATEMPVQIKLLLATVAALTPAVAAATQTITYRYDAKGRLIAVTDVGTVNGTPQTTYTYDPADNRTRVTIAGVQQRVATAVPHDLPFKLDDAN